MGINTKALVRDAVIVFGLTFLGGFVVGFANPGADNTVAIALSDFIFASLGFFIAGCLTKVSRFNHLSKVVLAVWLISALNMFIGATPIQWVFGLIVLFVTMGIGGGLSLLAVKAPKEIYT